MPYYAIKDAALAVQRIDFTDDGPPELDDGLTATLLAEGADHAAILRQGIAIEDLKTARWNYLKAEREIREFGVFEWDGSFFDADPRSQARLQGAVTMAQIAVASSSAFSMDWTLADNSARTMSAPDVIAAGVALAMRVGELHAVGRALRDAVMEAETADEVMDVSWPAGR